MKKFRVEIVYRNVQGFEVDAETKEEAYDLATDGRDPEYETDVELGNTVVEIK